MGKFKMNDDQNSNISNSVDEQTNSSEKRRDALRRILVGGGVVSAGSIVPETWTSTVLKSVVLPAHAQTSTTITSGMFAGTGPAPGI